MISSTSFDHGMGLQPFHDLPLPSTHGFSHFPGGVLHLLPPNGIEQKVETNLEGVAVAKGEHLRLDNEGGAEVTTPRTRYLTTGIQVMLAATQASPDRDAGQGNRSMGEAGGGAASGASGFKLVGMVVGIAAHSRVVSAGFGSYGAAMSIYYHFLARGRDVVYPKDMPWMPPKWDYKLTAF
jgi:hypothetical protein